MKSIIVTTILFLIVALSGCTDAKRAEFKRLGNSAHITAFNFSEEIYAGKSTGKLLKKEGGYLFVEEESGQTIQILGNDTAFVIRYDK